MINQPIPILPIASKIEKKAITHAMIDLNYAVTDIAKQLNINRSTVYRYRKEPLTKDLRHFATEIKIIFSIKQNQLLAKILKSIDEVIELTPDLKSLINAFEVLKKHTSTLHQIHREDKSSETYERIMG
jgi:predicted transcriptional regulator